MNASFPRTEAASAVSLFAVEGMRCAACISRIEHGLTATPGVIAARVNLSARRVRVDHDPFLTEDALLAAFRATGFDAHPFAGQVATGAGSVESRRLMLALGVAGFAAMNIMLLSVSVWSGAEGPTRQLFHWISALIAIPAVAYSGRPFFGSALGALRHRRTNMDVPISIGLIVTVGMSLYETATGGPHAYFDGAVMLLFFLLAGRFLDSVMRARAENSIAALLRRVPIEATLLLGSGRFERRSIDSFLPGDLVLVAAGERIAVDGKVVEGTSDIDRSLVTGESLPVSVGPGGGVLAGTINLAHPLTIRTTAVAGETAIADIVRLMEEAGQGKSRYVRIADRAARLYAPSVHSLAALSFLGWWISGAGIHHALLVAVAVLIITCPCALGLAVPIAQVVAAGALMRRGILIKDGSALERLATVDVALLDKTGTATLGRLEPSNLPEDQRERATLAALTGASRHPLARSVSRALERTDRATGERIVEQAGLGVEGYFDSVRWRFGRPDWVGATAEASTTVAAFARDGGDARVVTFSDTIRPDARSAMAALAGLGVNAMLVSGDQQSVVDEVASALDITALARVTPAEKNTLVLQHQAAGSHVLMVGDGLNDGPALKSADVAMAPAAASDVGQMSADLLFFGDSLDAVPVAIRASRKTMRVVRQNFALAIGYNFLAVPLAIMGLVTPLVAALSMSASSMVVVANALRLRGAAR